MVPPRTYSVSGVSSHSGATSTKRKLLYMNSLLPNCYSYSTQHSSYFERAEEALLSLDGFYGQLQLQKANSIGAPNLELVIVVELEPVKPDAGGSRLLVRLVDCDCTIETAYDQPYWSLSGVLAAYRGCCRHPSRLASESCLDQSKSLRSLLSCFQSQVCQP